MDFKIKAVFILLLQFCISESKLDTEWWKHTNIYELIVHNFKDSDGDGIGDLKGIISKLDYLKESEIETVYFTPMYPSRRYDMGYDVISYTEIDPVCGTMEDFDELVKEMDARGMKLILDLVINHSSNEHEWFKKSVEGIEPYTDYYIWKKPRNYIRKNETYIAPPNNWKTIFGPEGSAWTWNEKRQQFYYHMFMKEQPDLNFRNKNVRNEIKKIIKFWLDKGVSGFRLDAPMCYMEDKYFRNNTPNSVAFPFFGFDRQINQPETLQYTHELRTFLDEYNKQHGGHERIFAPEAVAFGQKELIYYGTKDYPVCHFNFNYFFTFLTFKISAVTFDTIINLALRYLPEGHFPAWASQTHDAHRIGNRISPEYQDITTVTTGLLPGIMHYYYGAEIGQMDGYVQMNQILDTLRATSRDPGRLPMQWDDSLNAGFSTNFTAYLPLSTDYYEINVETQKKLEISHYSVFKSVNLLRKTETIKYGDYDSLVYSANVHIFWRSYKEHETYIVITNLDDSTATVHLNKIPHIPKHLSVVTASTNSGYKKGIKIGLNGLHEFKLKPLSSVVLSSY